MSKKHPWNNSAATPTATPTVTNKSRLREGDRSGQEKEQDRTQESPEQTLSGSGGPRGRRSLVTGPVMSTLDGSGTRSSRGRGGK